MVVSLYSVIDSACGGTCHSLVVGDVSCRQAKLLEGLWEASREGCRGFHAAARWPQQAQKDQCPTGCAEALD